MKIIGAGMAGLLAANIFRKYKPTIYEASSSLPDSHKAVLRHRSNEISKATAIPFKKVEIIKEVCKEGGWMTKFPSLELINQYSMKVIGEFQPRSIANNQTTERFISPDSFVQDLAIGCDIKFNNPINEFDVGNEFPIISTMPVMNLLRILGKENELEKFDFSFKTIIAARIEIKNCNLYQTIYFPNPHDLPYRISITGNVAIYESMEDHVPEKVILTDLISRLGTYFGIHTNLDIETFTVSKMKYGKINNLKNQDDLKELIGKITKEYNIYSLGRFATWRNILLDDVLNDIFVIQKLIENRGYFTGK